MSIRDDLKAYLDGELSEERAAEVRAALDSDPALRDEAKRLKAISDTLRTANVEYAPVGLERTLEALQTGRRSRPTSSIFKLRWVLASAAGVMIIGTVLYPMLAQPKAGGMATDVAMVKGGAPALADTKHDFAGSGAAAASAQEAERPQAANRVGDDTEKVRAEAYQRKSLQSEPQAVAKRQVPFAQANGAVSSKAPKNIDSTLHMPSGANAEGELALKPQDQPRGGFGGGGSRGLADAAKADDALTGAAPATARISAPVATATLMAAKEAAPRLIINNGDVGVYVKDVKSAKTRAERYAQAAGGYIETSELQGDKPSLQTANMTLRVPVASYSNVLEQIKALGQVNHDSNTGADVTSQVIDTESRVKTMRSEEVQYRDIMKKAKRISEVLEVKDKLSDVRQEIESLDAQSKGLRNQATLSTISVNLSVKPKEVAPVLAEVKPDNWLGGTIGTAIDCFKEIAKALATVLIFLLVFLPLWGPVMALSFWGYKMSRPHYRY